MIEFQYVMIYTNNLQGFRKLRTNFNEWKHDMFRRGDKHRLVEIQRKKPSQASPAAMAVQATTSANTGHDHSISPRRDAPLNVTFDPQIVRKNKRLKKSALMQEIYKLQCMVQKVAGLIDDLSDDELESDIPVESNNIDDSKESA